MKFKKVLYSTAGVSVALAMLTTTAYAHADSSVTIRVGTWESGDGAALQQTIANNYMKTHPNVQVQIESVPDNYGTKILTEVAGGNAPDIFQIGDGDVSMFASKGAIADLTPYIKGHNGINVKSYYSGVANVGKVNGKYFTLPKDWSDLAVYYNKKLFDAAHVPYPKAGWTWDQFRAVAKKLTVTKNGKITQWGADLPGSWTRAVYPLVNAYGGKLANPNVTKFSGYMNGKGTVKAMQLYQQMYLKDKIAPSSVDQAAFQGVDLFQVGKVAMNITGMWPLDGYKSTPNFKFGTVVLPRGPVEAANTICYSGYGLYSQSPNKDAAWNYLKYLTGPEGEKVLSAHAFCALKSVAIQTHQTTDPLTKPFMDDVNNVKSLPEVTSPYFNNSGGKEFGDFLTKMLEGKVTNVQSSLNSYAKQSDTLYKQAKTQQ